MVPTSVSCLMLLALLSTLSAQEKSHPPKKPNDVPIIEVRATSNMDSDIGAGGIDIRIKGGTVYQPDLAICTAPVVEVAKKWAELNTLAIIKQDLSDAGLTLQMANPKEHGFFELLYRAKLKDKLATLTLFYYTSDGTAVLPEFVKAKGLDDLQLNLTKAITCAGNSTKSHS